MGKQIFFNTNLSGTSEYACFFNRTMTIKAEEEKPPPPPNPPPPPPERRGIERPEIKGIPDKISIPSPPPRPPSKDNKL